MITSTLAAIGRVATIGSFVFLMLFASQLHARPSVTGNIISWPNDAWYQVENVQTREIICQGGTQCEVPDGIYWVSWFDFDGSGGGGTRIIVGSPADENLDNDSFADTLSVDGNTINWSVGGWYQVQDASSFETVCNGDAQCEVEPGRYIVINHSLGLRSEVAVSGNTNGNLPNGIVLEGNTLSWPDDGWYQVQDATTYQAICNGGSECSVLAGSYIVINHHLGIRTNVEVLGDTVDTREVPRPSVQKLLGYSCTAEEFFFDRPAASENIVAIEVMREGVLLGTTNGTSFFTDSRPLGVAQRYDFTAIRADGARSVTIPYGTKSRC